MRQFNEAQMEKLAKIEHFLRTAHQQHYVMAMPMDDCMTILESYTYLGRPAKNVHCHKCVEQMTEFVAAQYFTQKGKKEIDNVIIKTEEESIPEVKTEVEDKPKKPKIAKKPIEPREKEPKKNKKNTVKK